ncbi:MAG TPA: zinc ribbon domain-containing protein [Gemmatimonadaceae bacterium]|nr:zinc ribbon domain-containing protein [Gemmatimonadaceae bacterium]
MDDLDRVFHRLVSNIRHRHSEYLTLPFTVQELYETLIPYRHHRRELGIETNQDYEIAVTRLLSGERDYLLADQSMRDKLKAELESAHMDPGAFREFSESKVSLAPEALRRIRALTASADPTLAAAAAPAEMPAAPSTPVAAPPSAAAAAAPSPPPVNATFPIAAPTQPATAPVVPAETAATAAPAALSSLMNVAVPEGCPFCGGTLPEGRNVVYCPHCGNNLSVSRCPACGSELEKGWKFCATCGRGVG